MVMLGMGRLFPRGDRSPAIEPVAPATLQRLMRADATLQSWQTGRFRPITGGFYKSQALEWTRS